MDRTHERDRQSTQQRMVRCLSGWRRLLSATAMGMFLFIAGAVSVQATPTVIIHSITPNYTAAPYSADVDGTFNTMFRIEFSIYPPQGQTITAATMEFRSNGWGTHDIFSGASNPDPNLQWVPPGGVRNRVLWVSGYWLASTGFSPWSGLFWDPAMYPRTIRFWARTSDGNAAEDSQTRTVCASGREVLLPADDSKPAAPEFRYPSSGGVTVLPADPQNADDGSSSSKYTYRVIYRHPFGLPPRPQDTSWNCTGSGGSGTTGYPPGNGGGVFNGSLFPLDDVWRTPQPPDVAVPPTVFPSGPNTQIALYIDTDLRDDGCANRTDPQDLTHVLGRQRVTSMAPTLPLVHWMVPEPGQALDAANYKSGVVYTYTVQPNSQEVSVGLPPNTYASTVSFSQQLVNAFGAGYRDAIGNLFAWRGMRYVDGDYRMAVGNNNRTRGYAPNGRMDPQYTAPFLGLSAGLHAFTYACTSDLSSIGVDTFGNPLGEIFRYADYNAPSVGAQNKPAKIFPGVADPGNVDTTKGWGLMQFRKPYVNPALDTDISTAPGSIYPFEIRIPTPVSVPTPLRPAKQVPEVLLAADPVTGNVQSTRALSGEKLRFKTYYTQSENVAPLMSQIVLFRKADNPAPGMSGYDTTKPYATITLQEDPPQGPYDTASGKPFYTDTQLPPGQYRYIFKAQDQRHAVEWPGQTGSGTSLTMELDASSVSNSVRVNYPPEFQNPKVEPAFGRSSTPYAYTVTYVDKDNDAPRYAFLFIGTNNDSIVSITTDPGNLNNAIITTAPRSYSYPVGSYINGEIAVRTTSGVLASASFPIVANGATSFTVADPQNILRSNAKNGDAIEVRRRVQMTQTDPTQTSYATGVEFRYDTAAESSLKLDEGTRSYHFQFTDNWGTAAKPEEGETVRYYGGVNNEIDGPVIQDNNLPQLSLGQVTPTSGTPATAFSYSARYLDLDNDTARDMALIIDPTFPQLAPSVGAYALGSDVDVTERTIRPSAPPSPAWTDNQWAGKVLKFTSGLAKDRWFVIAGNSSNLNGYTLTLVPGTKLIGKGGVSVAATDQFIILDVTGDVHQMAQTDTSDKLYSDGADYAVTAPIRLALGQHTFMFRASDGTSVVYDSTYIDPTTKVNVPSQPITGPDVHANTPPKLWSDTTVFDGTTAAGAALSAPTLSTVTLAGPVGPANGLLGDVLEILQADGTIRGSFEITANTDNSAGGTTVVTVNGNPVGLGVLPTDKFRIGRRPVQPNVGKAGTLFTWRIVYSDDDNDSPEAGYPAFIRLVIDGDPKQTYAMTRIDPTAVNFRTGVVYEYTTNTLATGAHSYFFEANDGANAIRFPTIASCAGPGVNDPPVLSSPTLATPAGSSQTTYRFEVTYQDQDNDAPDADNPRLVLFDPTGRILMNTGTGQPYFVMTPALPGPYNYVNGVLYRFDFTPTTPGGPLQYGGYTYRFEASSTGAKQTQPAPPLGPFNGPAVNNPPTLTPCSPAVSPAGGSPTSLYTFRVLYKDPDNNAPLNGKINLNIIKPDGSSLGTYAMTVDPTQASQTDFAGAGVVYQYQTAAGDLNLPGTYKFWFDAADTVQSPMISVPVNTQLAPVDGPTINNVPVLSQLGLTPQTGIRTTPFTFTVNFQDADNVLPTGAPKLFLYKPGTSTLLDPNGADMTLVAGSASSVQSYSVTLQLTETGTYRYYVRATDGVDAVVLPAKADTDAANAVAGPTVSQPVLSLGAVDPARATKTGSYSFRVMYTHAAGIQPSYVKVRVITPSGQDISAQLPGAGAMSTTNTQTAQIVSPGWLYTYTLDAALLDTLANGETGTYHYAFVASDGTLPEVSTEVKDGPTSVIADQASMSNPSVSVLPSDPTKVVYRVTYTQGQDLKPTYIKVVVDGVVSDDPAYFLSQENPADVTMTDGAAYAVTLPAPTGAGPHNYYFLALVPGLSTELQYPTPPALGPNSAAGASAPTDGTVSPKTGSTATRFTFKVHVQDVDSTSDPAVYVVVGNLKLQMAKVAGGDVRQGCDFTVDAVPGTASAMPAGNLVHSFLVNDGTTTTRFPLTTNLDGPVVLQATQLNATLSASQVQLDGVTPVQVTGVTQPAVPSAPITITYQPATGAAITQSVTADGQGRYNSSFVPNRTGTWTISLSYGGDGQSIGDGQQTLTLDVAAKPFQIPVGLGMIGLPVVPDGDLTSVLGTGGFQLARWNGSGYDFGPGGPLASLVPGMGMWIRTDAALLAQTAGSAVDHSQDYRVPVKAGWNQIANPFLTPISWDSVRLQAGGVTMTLADAKAAGKAYDHAWIYDGAQQQYVLVHATAAGALRNVMPWQGLWFRSMVDGMVTFPAPIGRSAVPTQPESRNRQRQNPAEWDIQLVASNGAAADGYNYAGVRADSRATDGPEIESPPMPQGHVDLYFPGAAGAAGRYATSYQPNGAGEHVWSFSVETDMPDRPISLKTPNLSRVPKSMEVVLEDVDSGKSTYLRTAGGYTYNPGANGGERHFRLVVRPRSAGAVTISNVTITPGRGGSVIGYTVSREMLVSAVLRSPSGKQVKMLMDRTLVKPGRASVMLENTRDDGAQIASGVYILELRGDTPEGQSSCTVKPIVVTRW